MPTEATFPKPNTDGYLIGEEESNVATVKPALSALEPTLISAEMWPEYGRYAHFKRCLPRVTKAAA